MLRRHFDGQIGARLVPGATTDLVWSSPLHQRTGRHLPERSARVRELLVEIDREVRSTKGQLTAQTAADQVAEIEELLGRAVPQPMPPARRRAGRSPAMNIGWEIEIAVLAVEGRHQRTILPGRWFLLGCLLDQEVDGFPGFSVQTDAGKIELVSHPPDGAVNPISVARGMARYAEKRLDDIRRSGQKDPWTVARSVGSNRPLSENGKQIQVRVSPEPGKLDGEFHATVGIHAAALPWFLLSGAAGDDSYANAKPTDETRALVPGHTFWSAADRARVLEAFADFRWRCHRADVKPSPALEGLVFLLLTYVMAATAPEAKDRDLSPKHKFLVLCRTDLAHALSLTPEWSGQAPNTRWIKKLRQAVLESLPRGRADEKIFPDRFGDPVPSFFEIWQALHRAGANGRDQVLIDFSAAIVDRKKRKSGYKAIQTKVSAWIVDLLARSPQDRLSETYHREHGTQASTYLHRGMGSLGSSTDRLAGGEQVPIFEYRRLTPEAQTPEVSEWADLARRFADAVATLNAVATDQDKATARAEIELVRQTSVPRRAGPSRDPGAEVDQICDEALRQWRTATMRAELWTLVDRVRGLTTPAPGGTRRLG